MGPGRRPAELMALDWAAAEAAGLFEGAITVEDRKALLELLAAEGLTFEEMVTAHRQGALMRVAGERVIRPGAGALTLSEVAARHGVEVELAQRILRALGAVDPGPDARTSSEDDVELVGTALYVLEVFGETEGWALLRRYGAMVERFTEATSSAVINQLPDISTLRSGSEAATARAWSTVAAAVPRLGRLLDLTVRHHIEAVRRYFETAQGGDATDTSFLMGVGFADLSGYTAASLELDLHEVARVVAEFEGRVTEEVVRHGGRVVKFVGDAVLFVCLDADALVATGQAIVQPVAGPAPSLTARAGLARGWVLARDGDYFGPAVNLAARLVDVTPPGAVLVDAALRDAATPDRWTFEEQPPAQLRGIQEPVATFLVRSATDQPPLPHGG